MDNDCDCDDEEFNEIVDAIEDALRSCNIATIKWILVAEKIDEDGDRRIDLYAPDDTRKWDILSLIEFIKMDMQAHTVVVRAEDG